MHSMSRVKAWMAISCCTVFLISFGANAQSTYDKAIKSAQVVGPLGNNLFGDSVNFYTGSLGFNATDLSIPGNNNLAVSIKRTYSVEFKRLHAAKPDPAHPLHYAVNDTRKYLLGDWDLDIPHISGTYAGGIGWQTNSTTPLARCSIIGQVKADGSLARGEPKKPDPRYPWDFWRGNTLYGNGDTQVMMLARSQTGPRPSGGPFHWTTNKDWWVSCIPAENTTGEGFLAVDPAGTKYTFSWMSTRNVGEINELVDLGNEKYRQFFTYLEEVKFLPRRIEDRFGNWVEYTYSADSFAKLQTIVASDGRSMSFHYNGDGFIDWVTDGTRMVRYAYTGASLSRVTLDDGSAWVYNFATLSGLEAISRWNPEDLCAQAPAPQGSQPPLSSYECVGYPAIDGGGSGSVIHPSGARADYLVKTHFHLLDWTGYGVNYPLSLAEKSVSGPGIAPKKWSYAFAPNASEVKAQCLAGACPKRIWTDELSPEHRVTRRMFGVGANDDQGLLLQDLEGYFPTATTTVTPSPTRITRMDRINGDPDLVQHASPVTTTEITGAPIFVRGTNFFYHRGNALGEFPGDDFVLVPAYNLNWSAYHLPVAEKVLEQSGQTFKYKVESWDAFDRPTRVVKSSTPTP